MFIQAVSIQSLSQQGIPFTNSAIKKPVTSKTCLTLSVRSRMNREMSFIKGLQGLLRYENKNLGFK